MTNSLNSKEDIVTALKQAIQSIRNAIEPIDELNGYLLELEEIEKEKLSKEANKNLEDVHNELYMNLPVWDTLESHVSQLEEVLEEITQKPATATAKLLEELTEESEG